MAQVSGLSIEREAAHRLPGLLADILDEDGLTIDHLPVDGIDLAIVDSRGRRWLVDIKSFSGPGQVVEGGHRLQQAASNADLGEESIALLVVPYMSEAGARVADTARINWLDLSGNASIRAENLRVSVRGRPNAFPSRGRPSSPFAPKSARVPRLLLLDPERWWRQKDLVAETALDDGTVSRVVRRLGEELLLENRGRELRARDPGLLLDAWAEDYRFDRHDIIVGHLSGSGIEIARSMTDVLREADVRHAFTGLTAAWAMDRFAGFRLNTVYVEGDPRVAADALDVRRSERGANVQIVGPDDDGVFAGERTWDELNCVSPAQAYLDLLHLPERADEAARHLRAEHLWSHAAT